jgi:hypothetical protein
VYFLSNQIPLASLELTQVFCETTDRDQYVACCRVNDDSYFPLEVTLIVPCQSPLSDLVRRVCPQPTARYRPLPGMAGSYKTSGILAS